MRLTLSLSYETDILKSIAEDVADFSGCKNLEFEDVGGLFSLTSEDGVYLVRSENIRIRFFNRQKTHLEKMGDGVTHRPHALGYFVFYADDTYLPNNEPIGSLCLDRRGILLPDDLFQKNFTQRRHYERRRALLHFFRQAKMQYMEHRFPIDFREIGHVFHDFAWYVLRQDDQFILRLLTAWEMREWPGVPRAVFDLTLNLSGVFSMDDYACLSNFYTWDILGAQHIFFGDSEAISDLGGIENRPYLNVCRSILSFDAVNHLGRMVPAPMSVLMMSEADVLLMEHAGRDAHKEFEHCNPQGILLTRKDGGKDEAYWMGSSIADIISAIQNETYYDREIKVPMLLADNDGDVMYGGREFLIILSEKISDVLPGKTIDTEDSSDEEDEADDEVQGPKFKILLHPIPEASAVPSWNKLLKEDISLSYLDEDKTGQSVFDTLVQEFPYMEEQSLYIAQHAELCRVSGQPFGFKPILLNGAPGIGKTKWAKRVAEICDTGYSFHSLAGSQGSMGITGSDRGWNQARPGFWAYAVERSKSGNPIVVMDELDKASSSSHNGSLLDSLLPFLEKETSSAYRDHFLMTEVNISHFSYVFTSNNDGFLPEALMSRLLTFQCRFPTRQEFEKILPFIIKDVRTSFSIPDDIVLDDLDSFIDQYQKEKSIRIVKSNIERSFLKKVFHVHGVADTTKKPVFRVGFDTGRK